MSDTYTKLFSSIDDSNAFPPNAGSLPADSPSLAGWWGALN